MHDSKSSKQSIKNNQRYGRENADTLKMPTDTTKRGPNAFLQQNSEENGTYGGTRKKMKEASYFFLPLVVITVRKRQISKHCFTF